MNLKFKNINELKQSIVKACECPDFIPDGISRIHEPELWVPPNYHFHFGGDVFVEINEGERAALQPCANRKACANVHGLDCCVVRKFKTDDIDIRPPEAGLTGCNK